MALHPRNFTKEEAIREHRKMWNWIADETLKQKKLITKEDYIDPVMKKDPDLYAEDFISDFIKNSCCFLCLYVTNLLPNSGLVFCHRQCPLAWPEITCWNIESPFKKWRNVFAREDDVHDHINNSIYEYAANLAREIANLPEREEG